MIAEAAHFSSKGGWGKKWVPFPVRRSKGVVSSQVTGFDWSSLEVRAPPIDPGVVPAPAAAEVSVPAAAEVSVPAAPRNETGEWEVYKTEDTEVWFWHPATQRWFFYPH